MPQPLFRRDRDNRGKTASSRSAEPDTTKPIATLAPKEVQRRLTRADMRGRFALIRLAEALEVPITEPAPLPRSATDAHRHLAVQENSSAFLEALADRLDEWLNSPEAA